MAIPRTLKGWTYDKIKEIVDKNEIENSRLDFKAGLPDVERLSDLACALANSKGGFVILGVRERGISFELKPLPFDKEISNKFGQRLKVEPPIDFDYKIVDVPESSKTLTVFHIPESLSKPHRTSIPDKETFWKRTNEGNKRMTFEEIKTEFQANLKQKIEELTRLSNEPYRNEAKRRLDIKKHFIHRIVIYYDAFIKKYKDFKVFCREYRTEEEIYEHQKRFELFRKNLRNLLNSFVDAAREDFKSISNIIDNPTLMDKFVIMIEICSGQFNATLSDIYLGSGYNVNHFLDLDSNIEFIDRLIDDLKAEIAAK